MHIDIYCKIRRLIFTLLFFSYLYSEKEVSKIRNLTIVGNDNISKNAILFLLRQKPPNLFFKKPKFFDLLAGTDQIRLQLLEGKTSAEIEQSWQPQLKEYLTLRKKYLLYPDFN